MGRAEEAGGEGMADRATVYWRVIQRHDRVHAGSAAGGDAAGWRRNCEENRGHGESCAAEPVRSDRRASGSWAAASGIASEQPRGVYLHGCGACACKIGAETSLSESEAPY